jgi:hypothetical protein
VDAASNRSTCSFTITVNPSGGGITLVIPGGKSSVEFSAQTAKRKTPKSLVCQPFSVQNTGGATALTLASLQRTAPNVNRLANLDDSRLFIISLVDAQQVETPLTIGSRINVGRGETKNFCVRFNPLIPPLSGATTGLPASEVIPDVINSALNFSVQGGTTLTVPLVGRVSTEVVFTNPDKPKKQPVFSFQHNGDMFVVTHTNYDSNSNVKTARYEFLDSSGQSTAFDIDLTGAIRDRNLLTGQTFQVQTQFSGANSHPEITSVRLTVMDGETSISVTVPLGASSSVASAQLPRSARRARLYTASIALRP